MAAELAQLTLSKAAYLGVSITFFVVAIICTLFRTSIRIWKWRRIYADDYFILLAFCTLIASSTLFFMAVPRLYEFEDILAGKAAITLDVFSQGASTAMHASIGGMLAWTTIFAVKFSFLFYFKRLVDRLRALTILWWFTLAITVPVAAICICSTYIVCPYNGPQLLAHCVLHTGTFLRRENAVLYYGVAADIVTDVLLISIPVALLWQTKVSRQQKFSIGIVLCLSIFMIAIALVRGITARVYGTSNQTWAQFCVQIESCVSVIMVCMTAFRTLFVAEAGSRKQRQSPVSARHWPRSGRYGFRRKAKPELLPDINTGATLTGMRTIIRENGRTTMGSFSTRYSVGPSEESNTLYSADTVSIKYGN